MIFFKLFFILCVSLQFTSFCFGMEQGKQDVLKDFKFNTLSAWTTHCFKNLKEYSTRATDFVAPDYNAGIEQKELIKAIDKLSTSYKTTLNRKELWVDEAAPQQSHWVDQKIDLEYRGTYRTEFKHSYVEKIRVPIGSNICFMGDYHASIHSLLRNLWRLVALGVLDDQFKIKKKNFHLIFLGDFVDRGRYGSEVWYTLCCLKLANPDKVFLLRGNHETTDCSLRYGFIDEVETKYGESEGQALAQKLFNFYRFLPHAVYLGPQVSKQKQFFVQCSHGGISCGAIDKAFEPGKLLDDQSGKKYLKVSNYEGFNWSDFQQDHPGITASRRGAGYDIGIEAAIKYLKKRNLKAFFRGHQDRSFGFKMFFADSKDKPDDIDYGSYFNGPYHWKYIVSPKGQQEKDGFLIKNYPPIFTFTSATEGQVVPYDCFGIVTVKEKYEDWRLKVYETHLETKMSTGGNVDRNEKYVSLYPAHLNILNNEHVIGDKQLVIKWKDARPGPREQVIDLELVEVAQSKSSAEDKEVKDLRILLESLKTKVRALAGELTILTHGA